VEIYPIFQVNCDKLSLIYSKILSNLLQSMKRTKYQITQFAKEKDSTDIALLIRRILVNPVWPVVLYILPMGCRIGDRTTIR